MKLIEIPFSLVCQLGLIVVELSLAVHLIILPLSFVEAAILVVELSLSISHSILLISLVPASNLVLLNNILRLLILSGRVLRL